MATDVEDEREEQAFERGQAAVYRELLSVALRGLGSAMPEGEDALRKRVALLEKERADTVAALRLVCAEHGSNEWTDRLYLADVVEKHLGRQLDETKGGAA